VDFELGAKVANDLNQYQCIGRLGKEPEVRYMANGKAVASFSVAVGSSWKDASGEKREETEWVNVTAFDKLGEICGEYLKKGSQVYISGRLKTDKYEKDGQTRYSTKVIADRMQMLGGKTEGGQGEAPQRQERPAKTHGDRKGGPNNRPDFDDMDSDSIPF
jgi:single-strand DNA-binding protein